MCAVLMIDGDYCKRNILCYDILRFLLNYFMV